MDAHRIPPAEENGARQRPWQERLLALLRNTVLIALGLLMMWLVGDVLLSVFAGILLAVFLRGLGDRVSRRTGLPVGLSLAVVIAAMFIAVAAVGYFLWPRTSEQLNQLATQLPQQFHRIEAEVAQTSWGKALIDQFQPGSGGAPQAVVGRVFGVATGTIGALAAIVVVFFVGLYLAADPETYLAGALRLVPPPRRPRIAAMLIEVASALWWWLIGRIFSMAIIAVMTAVGLALLGVPLALTLGLLSGVLSFVPYIGSVASGIPPVLIALTGGTRLVLYVIALYTLVHIVEGYILGPVMQQRMVRLPSALALVAQAILGSLFGVVGLALATPIAAAAIVAVRVLYVEDVLDDDTDRPLVALRPGVAAKS
ncbi:MAG TPA: AI-2E family transporter [Stellaceae bacterium]